MALIIEQKDAKDANQVLFNGSEVYAEKLITTDKQLMINHGHEDALYVRREAIHGQPGYFEFHKFEQKDVQAEREARWILINACMEQRAPFVIYPDTTTHPMLGRMVIAPAEALNYVRGGFHSFDAARKFCAANGLPYTEHSVRPKNVTRSAAAPVPDAPPLNAAQVALQILEVIRKERPDLIADNMPDEWGMNRLRRELSEKLLLEDSCVALANAIREKNSVVSVWSANDLDFIDELEETSHLSNDQLGLVKKTALASCSKGMSDNLVDSGGFFLSDWWQDHKGQVLEDLNLSPGSSERAPAPTN